MIQENLNDREISINFNISENDICNAWARKQNDKEYAIEIGPRLIQLLREYSWLVAQDEFIFSHIERRGANCEIFHMLSDFLMYLWIDFICLHEWSHVVYGHLQYLSAKNIYSLFEFEKPELMERRISNNALIDLEAEADRFAGKSTLTRLGFLF